MFKNKQIHIQGQFLHAALKTGRQKELVFFAICQMFFSHKTFNKSHVGKIAKFYNHEKNWVYKLIDSCVSWGIMVRLKDKDHTIRLINNEEIQAKFGGKLCASAYITHDILKLGVKAAIKLVRNIPNISCADSQPKGFKKNHNNTSKSDARAENQLMTIKEHQQLVKAKMKGCDKVTFDPTVSISNKKGSQLSGKSKPTFIKDKYFLETIGVWCVKRRYGILQEAVSMDEWLIIKNDLVGHGFPAFAKYNPFTQTIYRDLACEIITKKHA
jgi:hypothetical protein